MSGKHIAAAIIEEENTYFYLQLRDDIPGINYPNHWGLFGGSIEIDETPLDTIVRELAEELSLTIEQARMHFLGVYGEASSQIIHAFHYEAFNDMQTAVLQEGQRIGRFERCMLMTLQNSAIEDLPIIPNDWCILQDYLHNRV